MKTINTLLLCSCVFWVYAQTTKGVSVAYSSPQEQTGKTYALIVGISQYKNPAIPSLQFADRDALAFRNYLVASGVDSSNITLLLNEKASFAETMLSLDELCTQKAKAGDKVFIYFSGHGDVESRVITNVGYLLTYDAPKAVYAISAINVRTLQDYVSTLSAKGVQAIVITDACHSGNLAGGVEGMKNIQTVLGDKWKDEIKMLSCQPGELSIEGKQWGNGRGLFSYELINGMAGKADRNNDGAVSLRELNLYLLEKVPDAANPFPQNPVLIGDAEANISKTNDQILASLPSQQNNILAAIDVKGFDEELLNTVPDTIRQHYRNFNLYLDSAIYVRAASMPSAYYYLAQIPEDGSTRLLKGIMERNLFVEIMDHANMVMDSIIANYLFTGFETLMNTRHELMTLRKMVGDEKMIWFGFMSKALFFESIALLWNNIDSLQEVVLHKMDTAITYDPYAAYLFNTRSQAHFSLGEYQQALSDAIKASELSPAYALPYQLMGDIYIALKEYNSAIAAFNKLYPINDPDWTLRASVGKGVSYYYLGLLDSAGYYFDKPIEGKTRISQTTAIARRFASLKDYDQAIRYYNEALKLGSTDKYVIYNLACCYSLLNDKLNAIKYFEESIKAGFDSLAHIEIDTDLDNIRSTPEFKALMKKYFSKDRK